MRVGSVREQATGEVMGAGVMGAVMWRDPQAYTATAGGGAAGQSRNRSPFAMLPLPGDFDQNVSGNRQLTRL